MHILNVPSFAVRMVAGAGLEALCVGARTTTTGVWTALAVASPVVAVGRSVADGVLATVQRDASVAWSSGRRLHLDLAQLVPTADAVSVATEVAAEVSKVPGVAAVHVETTLGRLVVEREPHVRVEDVQQAVRKAAATLDETGLPRTRPPVADPGDRLAIIVPVTAAALDVIAVGAAAVGALGRLPAAPRAARAAAAMLNHQPRVVSALEARLGRVGTDFVLNAVTAATNGLGQAPSGPLLDLAQRVAQVAEAVEHRRIWAAWEPDLARPSRPQAPAVTVKSSAHAERDEPRHSWAAAAAGDVSHVVVDAAVDTALDTAKGATAGVVEDYVEQSASGALVAAAGALVASGNLEDVADSILAGVPKAAHVGREMFAAVLGRGLARGGQLVLDPGALRRLDRVQVIVVDGAALRGDAQTVLRAEGQAIGWDDDRVFEVADALLHGERAPEPDPDELPAEQAQLRWLHNSANAAAPAQGLTRAELRVCGEVVGTVWVGWELDPFAAPLIETARRSGTRVELRHVAGTEDLAAAVAATHRRGTSLLEVVRDARTDRGPVLLITALHPDFASTDTLTALAIADVGVALDDPRSAAPWTADIVTSTDLVAAVRIVSALPAARRASAAAVSMAKGGSTLAGLLLLTGETRKRGRLGLTRLLSPVNAAAAIALTSGALAARRVLTMPDPDPQPLTAWHALDAEIVYSRLTAAVQPLAAAPVYPVWRRRLGDLSDSAIAAPLRGPARQLSRLAVATRSELNDPLTPVLAIGAAASAILGSSVDALLVGGVMTVNALVGGVQRLRADNAAAELFAEQEQYARRVAVPVVGNARRRLTLAATTKRTVLVPAARLRPGDIIDLRAPDVVPADARLLCVLDLEVDESSLTGESVPVEKQVDSVPAAMGVDRASMVFEGSTIVAGSARAIVTATGNATAARRAIWTVSDIAAASGIAARLRDLTSKVLPLTLAGGGLVTGLSLIRRHPLRQAVADGVAIAVAAVPEGLPLVATLAQLAAARRLSRLGVLVRTPRTLEALGRVDTICFDKTGTLTENRLKVVAVATADHNPRDPFTEASDARAHRMLRAARHASPQPEAEQPHAHATDEAILTAAATAGLLDDPGWDSLADVPFESSRGYAAALGVRHRTSGVDAPGDERVLVVLKGAPEVVHRRCRFPDPAAQAHAESLVLALAEQGLRVIAVAEGTADSDLLHGDLDIDATIVDAAAQDLEIVGYLGLADTPRPTARPLLEQLTAAGRNVVLLTGDHPVTARAIARQLGLPADVRVATGAEIADCDEEARAELAATVQVFARVSPEQKMQVVTAMQQAGRATAMVGDGANDAAAIRAADVGIGVSSRGSSAARGAADLVLTGADLTILLDALVEGRNMWHSVRDALVILLGGNAGEVAFTIAGTALSGRAPIGTRQLLLVNLLTDMFPALAVAVTPQKPIPAEADDDTDENPECARIAEQHAVLSETAPSLDRSLVEAIISRGTVTAAAATIAWTIGRATPGTRRRSTTMGLTALVGTQMAQTLLARAHSPLVVATAVGSSIVLVGIVQTPGISHFFGCTPLGPVAWTGVIAAVAGTTAVGMFAPAWLSKHTCASASSNEA
ncbi:HAD-IC family P-type ATPase [Nocardia sp. NPDC049526]|uniref:HAD-IC family P-type ATPase n=1 Tax=Nocardia sp. NPDC049526 TaxID=3364316 RepID=UPI0037BADA3E